jgi:putative transposase
MARPLRIEYPGAWYHVLNRGRRKGRFSFRPRTIPFFKNLLGRCCDLFELEIHAYSLMPNHYHLLVRTPRGNLSRAMRHLDGMYTQKVNRRHELEGALFKGRFKSILVSRKVYDWNSSVTFTEIHGKQGSKTSLEHIAGQVTSHT